MLLIQQEVEDAAGPLLDKAHELLGLCALGVLCPGQDPGLADGGDRVE